MSYIYDKKQVVVYTRLAFLGRSIYLLAGRNRNSRNIHRAVVLEVEDTCVEFIISSTTCQEESKNN